MTPSSQVYKELRLLVKKNVIDPRVRRELYETIDLLMDTVWEEAAAEMNNIRNKLEMERKDEIGKLMKAAKQWNGTANTEEGNGNSGDAEKDGEIDTVAKFDGTNGETDTVAGMEENEGSEDGQPETVLYTKPNVAESDTNVDVENDGTRSIFHRLRNRIIKRSSMKTWSMKTPTTTAEPLSEKSEMPSNVSTKDDKGDKTMKKMISAKSQSTPEYSQMVAADQQQNAKANGAEEKDDGNDDCGDDPLQQPIPEAKRDWINNETFTVSSNSTTFDRLSTIQEETETTTRLSSVFSDTLVASNGHPVSPHPTPNTTTNKKKMSVGKVVNWRASLPADPLPKPRRSGRFASLSSSPAPSISPLNNSANLALPEILKKKAKENAGGPSRADPVPSRRSVRLADEPMPDYWNRKSFYTTATKY